MAQKPSTIALIIVGAVLCFLGIILSFLNMPYFEMWAFGIPGAYMAVDILGNLKTVLLGVPVTVGAGSFLNYLPLIMILLGAGLSFGGIRVKGLGIAGGVIAILGPVAFIALLLTEQLSFGPGGLIKLTDMFTGTGTILFGNLLGVPWYLSGGTFLPLIGGILATAGSSNGNWE